MDAGAICDGLRKRFPDGHLKLLPESSPTEIVCELGSVDEGKTSTAIAVIEHSVPHVHHRTTETYRVTDGTGTLTIDGRPRPLRVGDTAVIRPGQIHGVVGDPMWVEVECSPAYSASDHILCPDAFQTI